MSRTHGHPSSPRRNCSQPKNKKQKQVAHAPLPPSITTYIRPGLQWSSLHIYTILPGSLQPPRITYLLTAPKSRLENKQQEQQKSQREVVFGYHTALLYVRKRWNKQPELLGVHRVARAGFVCHEVIRPFYHFRHTRHGTPTDAQPTEQSKHSVEANNTHYN